MKVRERLDKLLQVKEIVGEAISVEDINNAVERLENVIEDIKEERKESIYSWIDGKYEEVRERIIKELRELLEAGENDKVMTKSFEMATIEETVYHLTSEEYTNYNELEDIIERAGEKNVIEGLVDYWINGECVGIYTGDAWEEVKKEYLE